jgi:hypothetical protein
MQPMTSRVRVRWAVLGVALLLTATAWAEQASPEPMAVPHGGGVLLNGFLGENEWNGQEALRLLVCDSVELFLMQDSQYVYLGIRSTDTLHTGIDLYIADSRNHRRLLHVSSAHGEQDFADDSADGLTFGVNRYWSSNVVESYYDGGKMQWLAPEIFEFQIDKLLTGSDLFRLMVHFKRPERTCPASAVSDVPDNWLEFRLSP